MKILVIAAAACGDLENIAQHTNERWGPDRKHQYLESIRERLNEIRENPQHGTPRDDLRAGTRSVRVGKHVIFYRDTENKIEVIRILHERMDMHRYVSGSSDVS